MIYRQNYSDNKKLAIVPAIFIQKYYLFYLLITIQQIIF